MDFVKKKFEINEQENKCLKIRIQVFEAVLLSLRSKLVPQGKTQKSKKLIINEKSLHPIPRNLKRRKSLKSEKYSREKQKMLDHTRKIFLTFTRKRTKDESFSKFFIKNLKKKYHKLNKKRTFSQVKLKETESYSQSSCAFGKISCNIDETSHGCNNFPGDLSVDMFEIDSFSKKKCFSSEPTYSLELQSSSRRSENFLSPVSKRMKLNYLTPLEEENFLTNLEKNKSSFKSSTANEKQELFTNSKAESVQYQRMHHCQEQRKVVVDSALEVVENDAKEHQEANSTNVKPICKLIRMAEDENSSIKPTSLSAFQDSKILKDSKVKSLNYKRLAKIPLSSCHEEIKNIKESHYNSVKHLTDASKRPSTTMSDALAVELKKLGLKVTKNEEVNLAQLTYNNKASNGSIFSKKLPAVSSNEELSKSVPDQINQFTEAAQSGEINSQIVEESLISNITENFKRVNNETHLSMPIIDDTAIPFEKEFSKTDKTHLSMPIMDDMAFPFEKDFNKTDKAYQSSFYSVSKQNIDSLDEPDRSDALQVYKLSSEFNTNTDALLSMPIIDSSPLMSVKSDADFSNFILKPCDKECIFTKNNSKNVPLSRSRDSKFINLQKHPNEHVRIADNITSTISVVTGVEKESCLSMPIINQSEKRKKSSQFSKKTYRSSNSESNCDNRSISASLSKDCSMLVNMPNGAISEENFFLQERFLSLLKQCKPLKIVLEDCKKENSVRCNSSPTESSLSQNSKPLRVVLKDSKYKELKSVTNKIDSIIVPDIDDSIFENKTGKNFERTSLPIRKAYIRRHSSKPRTIPSQIRSTLRKLENTVFTEDNIESIEHDLVGKLTGESEISDIIFWVLKFLSFSNKNPLRFFKETRDPFILMPPLENCLVSALLKIDSLSKLHYEDFLPRLMLNIHHLLLSMNALTLHGSCALCRVFTKICKILGNKKEPLSLSCDLLKMKHAFAPILISCIAGVWTDLFSLLYQSTDEERLFYGSLVYGCHQYFEKKLFVKKDFPLKCYVKASQCIIDKYMAIQEIYPTENIIDTVFESIKKKCIITGLDDEHLFAGAIVIFAAFQGHRWSKKYIVEKHLLPCISRYSHAEKNERALILFCKLYAEISFFCPKEKCNPENYLYELFETEIVDKSDMFIRDASALALIQLLLSRKKLLPDNLRDWLLQNEKNPNFSSLRYVCHRGLLSFKNDFTKADII